MTKPKIAFFDILTQEEIIREMNDNEYNQYQADQIAELARQAEAQARAEAKAALLAQLGITEEQAKLLLS